MKIKNSKFLLSLSAILMLIITAPIKSNAQWVQLNFPVNGGMMCGIDFIDSQRGTIGGWRFYEGDIQARCYYTTNSVNQWYQSVLPGSLRSILEIKFLTDSSGIAVGAFNQPNSDQKIRETNPEFRLGDELAINRGFPYYTGAILKTSNRGASWTASNSIPKDFSTIISVDFIDSQTGYICGDNQIKNKFTPKIYKTNDAGNNWIEMKISNFNGSLRRILCRNEYVYCAGYMENNSSSATSVSDGILLMSTNSGVSWSNTIFPLLDHISGIKFIDANTGFICGVFDTSMNKPYSSGIYKTTNAGINWIEYLNFDSSYIDGMGTFENSGTILAYGTKSAHNEKGNLILTNPIIIRSSDYGNTWTENIVLSSGMLLNCRFLSPDKVFISGGNPYNVFPDVYIDPVLLYSNTGGALSVKSESTGIPPNFTLHQNYPNPFNPTTKINYELRVTNYVSIKVYDVLGNEVKTLVNQKQNAGSYEVEFDGSNISSGTYFYRLVVNSPNPLESNGFIETKKMLLIK